MSVTDLIIHGVCTADGRSTTVKLEPEFWELLKNICAREGQSLSGMVKEIDRMRGKSPRTSAIRVFILKYLISTTDISTKEFFRVDNDLGLQPLN
jgi:predicted DNA-binding ribbon-helix-helix protein